MAFETSPGRAAPVPVIMGLDGVLHQPALVGTRP